ncbi:MAG TPA: OmpA family protein [Acidobacteriaceae bacterium]|jgi:outer membrane protein OmpA-like peptidoglycan-associated protein|nr:OmpA family protein [Acidobacteriaceae bacterium]
MKASLWLPMMLIGCTLGGVVPTARSQSIFDRIKQKAKDKVNQKEDNAATSVVNGADPTAAKNASDNGATSSTTAAAPASSTAASGTTTADVATASTPSITISYQNYDFVPGSTIIFADDFTNTADGEFPDQWELSKGQAVVNKEGGYQAFLLTDGNYARVSPRMKEKTYLGPQFTLEFDVFAIPDAYPMHVEMDNGDNSADFYVSRSEAQYEGPHVSLAGSLPPAIRDDVYDNKWHHIAMVYRKPQMKIYVDQYRVLTVPDTNFEPQSLVFEGIGDQEKPITFRDVRIADGGGMNLVGKKFTDAKIVTHGINFDVDKATLRPESMGTLNQIKSIMDADPALRFEIDGHTDNTGDAAHNLGLSQQRADAVKTQLVTMGIDASRLTTKGFGDTKPLTSNDTPEGKANNRRVEFVRMSS